MKKETFGYIITLFVHYISKPQINKFLYNILAFHSFQFFLGETYV